MGFAAIFATLGLFGSGCVAPYRAISFEHQDPARRFPNRKSEPTAPGFQLAATLLSEPDRAAEYFYGSLPDSGVIPVLLHIENGGSRAVVLNREAMELVLPDEDATRCVAMDPRQVIRQQRASPSQAMWGLPLIVPFFILNRQIWNFNFDLTADYLAKSLKQVVRVTPEDEPFTRVLFFQVPQSKQQFLKRSCSLRIPIEIEALSGPDAKPGGSEDFSIGLEPN